MTKAAVVLHDLDVAAAHAGRVVLFRQGRVMAPGHPEEVVTTERLADAHGWALGACPPPHSRTGKTLRYPGVARAFVDSSA